MATISPSQLLASASLLRRVRLMAEFIATKHREEFDAYWAEKWPGKAEPTETLAFFRKSAFPSTYYLMRIENDGRKR